MENLHRLFVPTALRMMNMSYECNRYIIDVIYEIVKIRICYMLYCEKMVYL